MNEPITYYFIRNGKVSSDTSVPVGNVYMIGTDKAPLQELIEKAYQAGIASVPPVKAGTRLYD